MTTPSTPLILARSRRAAIYAFALAVLFFDLPLAVLAQKTDRSADSRVSGYDSDRDEITVLDPFVVSASEDRDSYEATATMAATRIRTELKDVGSAISVVTSQFLKDTNSHNSQDLLVYTPNTEVGGSRGNFSGLSILGAVQRDAAARLAPQNNTRVRGLTAADNTRDFFLTDIAWDGFNVGRIDIQRGPNAILFGLGSPAGIINASTNSAAFKNEGSVTFSTGSFGSHRATLDLNRVLLPDELALRFDQLDDWTNYEQKPAFNRDRRVYGALRWDPKFFRYRSARTSLRLNYEHGKIDANRPHVLPPTDLITPWFTQLNKRGVNPATWQYDPSVNSLVTGLTSPAFGNFYAVFDNPTSGQSALITSSDQNFNGLAQVKNPVDYLPKSTSPAEQFKLYGTNQLQDRTIFDYVRKLPEGPNKREWSGHEIVNVTLAQTFLNDRLGFELAFDRQQMHRAATNGSDGAALTMDINSQRLDGSPNPNFGRVFLQTAGTTGNWFASARDAKRFTGFGELRFKEVLGDSPLTRVLGRHVFTGLWSRERADVEQYSWLGQIADDAFVPYFFTKDIFSRQINTLNYLGSSLADRTSAAGANLPSLSAIQPVSSGSLRYFDYGTYAWKDLPFGVAKNTDGARAQTLGAFLRRDEVESQAFVWQGFLFDELVVPMVGLRHDRDRGYALTRPPLKPDNSTDFASPAYRLPASPNGTVSGDSVSWSVVAHVPKILRDKLPGRTEVSLFYNHSENFQPKAGRIDPLGVPLAPPVGQTKDYGFRISTFDGRLSLKVNWYDTLVANDALPDLGGFWHLTASEIWGYSFARQNLEGLNNFVGGYQSADATQTGAQAQADGIAISNAFLANLPPDAFFALYGIDRTKYATGIPSVNPAFLGVTITGDTWSKGVEYEFSAQLKPNWNIVFNASQTHTRSYHLAQSVSAWIEQRWAVFNTPVAGTNRPAVIGDVRLWGPWANPQTVRDDYRDNIWIPYSIYRAKENSSVSESRPWHFNLITDYTFAQGRLKGWKIGGAYRWQDQDAVGYPVLPGAGSTPTAPVYDFAHPYLGPAESNVDLWLGYERKFAKKYTWRIQLNVNNVFANKDLIPVTVQPDGSLAAGRIPPPRIWTLTNSISF